jgi:hypothetical protein
MRRLGLILILCASTFVLLAQQPRVSNTQFTIEQSGGKLTDTVDRFRNSAERIWIGYEVPALPQSHLSTCSNWPDAAQVDDGCCGEYRLEDSDNYGMNRGDKNPVAQNIYVLLRFDHGQLIKIRPVMAGCHLDAGGVPFTWLTGVSPEDSVSFLAQAVTQASDSNHVRDEALLAMSYHATPEATHALSEIASASSADMRTREQAAFWLGVQRGHEGFLALQSLEGKPLEPAFREKLPFDFSQNSDPAAQDELFKMAKDDPDSRVREQAIFWLAQKAGKKATAAIADAVQNDPETDVKKKAVFALSQLPKDESVPQLIHVADTNTNPAVRREAFFWLGQSHDPRALAYLEQVLQR